MSVSLSHISRSKIFTEWFKERPHIQLIKWPGNSPDLNPIENAWSWIQVQLKNTHPTNQEELKDEIRKLWVLKMDNFPYLKKLVKSMPNRIPEVISRGGNVTRY